MQAESTGGTAGTTGSSWWACSDMKRCLQNCSFRLNQGAGMIVYSVQALGKEKPSAKSVLEPVVRLACDLPSIRMGRLPWNLGLTASLTCYMKLRNFYCAEGCFFAFPSEALPAVP